ncbi:MAG: carbohydrate porin [Betaproteobacteria bacterium]|nr:carbohydrate porin [Betaproteobacteria bacterium]
MHRHLPFVALLALPYFALAEAEQSEETWQIKGQATYVWQKSGSFPATYSGPNSLDARGETAYTFTTTAYLGIRPWRGGEAYLNIEAGQGDPLSGLTGLGGFTNGEATRVSGTQIKAYRQRLFLRQTWALGEETEYVEADFNQLAGHVAKDRFVLTIGNFSSLDVFDDNKYAKDPRRQFLNWSNMAHAAYDYAADARGFGWGFAAEWYQGDWTLRLGRMTGPKEPNGQSVDFNILNHYGDQIELEHRHAIAGQAGAVRLLAFRNRAVLARYRDASAWLASHPGSDPQAIFDVRNGEVTKYGLGLNVEQAVNDELGVFLRIARADGRTETYAFTEVDSSFATGLELQGNAWRRPGDTLGLAWMRNTISKDRRSYLSDGGISFFIGDGALKYQPESIIEAYYSVLAHRGIWLTANFQHIDRPAYNDDRGPVNVTSLRFHAEF